MKLDEAINHCHEKAKELRQENNWGFANTFIHDDTNCVKCAEDHEQLAEWLEELRERRKNNNLIINPVGKWIPFNPEPRGFADTFQCSNCGRLFHLSIWHRECPYDFCPNCGAKMEDEDEEE